MIGECDKITACDTGLDFLEKFNKKTTQLRVPVSGGIDLTHRCNLRCVHCYLGPQSDTQARSKKEMKTDRLLSVIDEITEAGCLYFLVTGGEPLLHKDFGTIYRHMKSNGLLVTVFTNGTLITDSVLDLFEELPPQAVEISLYGATRDTYERIAGVPGSFERCLSGVKGLLDRGIRVKLKTILMTLNRHEFFDIENMAKELGASFRFDAAIFPRLDGDKTPLKFRVSSDDAVEKEFSSSKRAESWLGHFRKYRGIPVYDTLYNCGAGLTSFHLDPYGNLQPCLMSTDLRYDLSEGTFAKGWYEVIPMIRRKKVCKDYLCNKCEQRTLCGYCPAFFRLETGSEDQLSGYLCSMGKKRFELLNTNR